MAKTTFATSNVLTKKAWEEELFRDTVKESFFAPLMKGGSDGIIHSNTKLTKDKGDTVYFGLVSRLDEQNYKTSGETMEGNEQALTDYNHSVSLEEYVLAVRDRGPLDRQRAMFSIDEESRNRLKDGGAELIDSLCFTALRTSPTRVFYATSSGITSTTTAATAKAAMDATYSKLTPQLMHFIKTWAVTGGNRGQTPLRPVKYQGKNYFVMLVHPDCLYDLYQDSTFTQAIREAEVRGGENPLFTGAKAIWNGIIVKDHESVQIATDGGGASVPWAHCHFLGAQSLCWAWGKRPEVVSETFDYEREHGYAWKMIAGVNKAKFNSKDYGTVSMYVSRTQIADLS